MIRLPEIAIDDKWILSHRPARNKVDPYQPYAFLVEEERTSSGVVEPVATVFLTNRECPFRCLMCDLWKNTTDTPVPVGAIPAQLRKALEKLPPAKHIKLYNSGNFFDAKAIPPADHEAIAALLDSFESVIVECHPRLIDERCLRFNDLVNGKLEIAIGLETAHPKILARLNKRMDLDDFAKAVRFCNGSGIPTRAFTLLRPPFLSESEGVTWAIRTLEHAFETGVECCVVIPTRAGNGAMDWLQENGYFTPPSLASLEEVMAHGIAMGRGRVFADLWDLERFSECPHCFEARKERLGRINLTQMVPEVVKCPCWE
jgi:radical SAM enzyme (TIGR01210 family)